MQTGLVIFVVVGQKIVCQFMKDKRAMFTYNFLACLDEFQEELLYYPGCSIGVGIGKMLKFYIKKLFYVMGKVLSVELSCPCDRSCLNLITMYKDIDINQIFRYNTLMDTVVKHHQGVKEAIQTLCHYSF